MKSLLLFILLLSCSFCFSSKLKNLAGTSINLVNLIRNYSSKLNLSSDLNLALQNCFITEKTIRYGQDSSSNYRQGICGREDFSVHECTKRNENYYCTCYTDCTAVNSQGYCIAWYNR